MLTREISKRAACREYGLHWTTLQKILAHVEPPGYRSTQRRGKPKLGPFLSWMHAILEAGAYERDGAAAGDAMRSILADAERLSTVR